jgi:hypothetical protein
MSTRSATIELGGSAVRRPHLLIVAAMLVLAIAAGIVAGRVSGRGATSAEATNPSHAVILPVSALSTGGIGATKARVYRAMNRFGPDAGLDASLSGYSTFRRQASSS